MNRKVTFVIGSLNGGGAQRVCVNIANNLIENNWSVTIIVLNLYNSVYHDQLNSKINLINLEVNHTRFALIHLVKYFKNLDHNLIVTFDYELSIVSILLKKIFRLNIKILVRNINTFSQVLNSSTSLWANIYIKFFLKTLYGKADYFINQCQEMQDDLLIHFPGISNKTCVINNPVSQEIISFISSEGLNTHHKDNYILFVGRLEKQKAPHRAILIFSKITEYYPDLRFKIVGTGSLEADLKSYAQSLAILEKIDFIGFQKDVVNYYLRAKVTILTSIFEGFPNVLIESISIGTPVVSFNCPSGIGDIIVDGKNGFIAQNNDIDDFVSKLLLTIKLEFDKQAVLSSGIKFYPNSIISNYIDVIQKLNEN
jgi:glycosyltransferase involved in cell wall biosynthesis